jgi:pimeloyl-ACP methyl ester carboxylesterase/DNA-binding CsgD family transcriptional regulator
VDRRGYAAAMPASFRTPPARDQVRFCRSIDGARIAYATHGDGPPLLVNTCWLSHLQHDWESPVWRHFLLGLGRIATVTRYDERGFGLSDRDVPDFTFESRVADLEAVVEAAGLDRFALLGMAQGGPVAVAYAHRHPDRLTRLILASTFAAMVRRGEDEALHDTFSQMIRVGWARPDALFRRVFTNMMIPGATEEQMRWIDELQRISTTADVLLADRPERMKVDVTDLLGELRVPTLVIHAMGDQMADFAEARILAASIPGARLVTLDSANHILLADEPAWPVYLSELTGFLAPDRRPAEAPTEAQAKVDLTDREQEILQLAARGLDNVAIAERLTLSVRTVERHLSNVYTKLGVSGKVARTAAVAHLLSEES